MVGQLCADQPVLYEQVYYTLDNALEEVFPKANRFEIKTLDITPDIQSAIEERLGWAINEKQFLVHQAFQGQTSMGFALVLDELGKYYPITFMTSITPDFKVNEVVVMVYREKIGASVRKKRFLNQFRHKNSKDPLVVDQDITGITGATVSSWALSAGVKKALVLTEELAKTL